MWRVVLLSLLYVGCVDPNPLADALKSDVPNDQAVSHWGDEHSAAYTNRVVESHPELIDNRTVKNAWKKGIVRAVLEDEVTQKSDSEIDHSEVERVASNLRIDALTKSANFSGLSFYRDAKDDSQTLDDALPYAVDAREALLREPTHEALRRLHTKYRNTLPEGLRVALKINGKIAVPLDESAGGKLWQAIRRSKPGDVPKPVETENAILVIIHEGVGSGEFDERKIQAAAEETVRTKLQSERYLEFMKSVYGPTQVTFHPGVISDDTQGTQ